MPVTTTKENTRSYVLTASDRCDRCGAQAYYKVELISDRGEPSQLMWCKHDFDKNKVRLVELAVEITDESDKLVQDKLRD